MFGDNLNRVNLLISERMGLNGKGIPDITASIKGKIDGRMGGKDGVLTEFGARRGRRRERGISWSN